MLFGEHAVLRGKLSLVCAVNRRIRATLMPRHDWQVLIASDLGRCATTVHSPKGPKPLRFALGAIARQRDKLPSGFELSIESEFSSTIGLGSSAAVTAVVTALLHSWSAQTMSLQRVFSDSLHVIREVQGLGSGADVAASVFGGIVAYRADPLDIKPQPGTFPLTVIYSGSKTPTIEVVRRVNEARDAQPERFDALFSEMDRTASAAAEAIRKKDWPAVGALMNAGQELMAGIGVSNAQLDEIVGALRADPSILGSKISGSGLGDCVIGLGKARRKDWPYAVLPVEMSPQGLQLG